MKLSIVIPAYNEEGSIQETVTDISNTLKGDSINYEILVVNDNSTDGTETILSQLVKSNPQLKYINNKPPNGIGLAIHEGFRNYSGDAVAIVMADGSDSPKDIVEYYKHTGTFPKDNVEAGLSEPENIKGKHVKSVTVTNGIIEVRFYDGYNYSTRQEKDGEVITLAIEEGRRAVAEIPGRTIADESAGEPG